MDAMDGVIIVVLIVLQWVPILQLSSVWRLVAYGVSNMELFKMEESVSVVLKKVSDLVNKAVICDVMLMKLKHVEDLIENLYMILNFIFSVLNVILETF
jgi:hypothetical protein